MNPIMRKSVPYVLLGLTLAFAFWIRSNTFWLPHWQGDQSQYLTLAMKISKRGLDDYNLKSVQIRTLSLANDQDARMIYPLYNPNDPKGDMIRAYEKYGLYYYDMPLFFKAPLFPNILAMSHQWFTRGNHPFLVVYTNLKEKVWKVKPYKFFEAQAWAVSIPLLASLLTAMLVFFFGKMFFGVRAGIFAAMIMATHPVDILASNRLWTESLLTLFVTLSLFIFFKAYHQKDYMGIAFAGVACGLAVLTKQNGGMILVSVWIYTVLCHSRETGGFKSWLKIIFNGPFIVYAAGFLIISGHWFWRVFVTYGNPLYDPDLLTLDTFDPGGWHTVVLPSRPHPGILFLVGVPYICPFFGLIIFTLKKFWHQLKDAYHRRGEYRQVLFAWVWILPMFFFFVVMREHSKEHRYLLPIYPAFALLAAHVLDYLRLGVEKVIPKRYAGDIVVFLLIVISAIRSVPMGIQSVLNEQNLIFEPF